MPPARGKDVHPAGRDTDAPMADPLEVQRLSHGRVDAGDEFCERRPLVKVLFRLPALSRLAERTGPTQRVQGIQYAGVHLLAHTVRQLKSIEQRDRKSTRLNSSH